MPEEEKKPAEMREESGAEEDRGEEAGAPEPEKKPLKETLYDKIPLNFKQADILVKVLIGLLAVLLLYGVFTGSRMN